MSYIFSQFVSPLANQIFVRRNRPHNVVVDEMLNLLYAKTGKDFRNYKKASIIRRIDKRLKTLNIDSYESYLTYLENNDDEHKRLVSVITIKVSEFLRDPEVFSALAQLLKDLHTDRDRFKVWCCGCATGEEAYSLSILLEENFNPDTLLRTTVYATDIDAEAVAQCRVAEYRPEQLKNLSSERLNRHFIVASNAFYKVNYQVRSRVRFGVLDIVKDKVLSGISVLVCRNMLIYFNKALQETVFKKFYFSLAPGGLLVLGKAERIPAVYANLFELVDSESNIFRKKQMHIKR